MRAESTRVVRKRVLDRLVVMTAFGDDRLTRDLFYQRIRRRLFPAHQANADRKRAATPKRKQWDATRDATPKRKQMHNKVDAKRDAKRNATQERRQSNTENKAQARSKKHAAEKEKEAGMRELQSWLNELTSPLREPPRDPKTALKEFEKAIERVESEELRLSSWDEYSLYSGRAILLGETGSQTIADNEFKRLIEKAEELKTRVEQCSEECHEECNVHMLFVEAIGQDVREDRDNLKDGYPTEVSVFMPFWLATRGRYALERAESQRLEVPSRCPMRRTIILCFLVSEQIKTSACNEPG